jgi:hypothetical protein
MLRKKSIWIPIALAILSQACQAEGLLSSGLYQIISGSYSECCGIAGDLGYPLPHEKQAFVRLKIDSETNSATMTFLANDQQTIFTVFPCPPALPIEFNFENGLVSSNEIVFHIDPTPDRKEGNYKVTVSGDTLKIDGNLSVDPGNCADVPTQFSHSNVVAVGVSSGGPILDEVQRDGNSFRFHFTGEAPYDYTVEYTDSLAKPDWLPLATYRAKLLPIDVTVTNSLRDVLHRFFRVRKEPCNCD